MKHMCQDEEPHPGLCPPYSINTANIETCKHKKYLNKHYEYMGLMMHLAPDWAEPLHIVPPLIHS
ncbi:hypothetical protein CBL_09303 [Carabus blaptoides fortunei]